MMERRFRGLSYKNCGRTYKLTDAQKNSLPTKLLNFININGIAHILSEIAFSDISSDEKSPIRGDNFLKESAENLGDFA